MWKLLPILLIYTKGWNQSRAYLSGMHLVMQLVDLIPSRSAERPATQPPTEKAAERKVPLLTVKLPRVWPQHTGLFKTRLVLWFGDPAVRLNLTLLSRTTLPWWDTGCSYIASQHTSTRPLTCRAESEETSGRDDFCFTTGVKLHFNTLHVG